jgi:hypothetical protein
MTSAAAWPTAPTRRDEQAVRLGRFVPPGAPAAAISSRSQERERLVLPAAEQGDATGEADHRSDNDHRSDTDHRRAFPSLRFLLCLIPPLRAVPPLEAS